MWIALAERPLCPDPVLRTASSVTRLRACRQHCRSACAPHVARRRDRFAANAMGMTLLELTITVFIVGVLIELSVALYGNYRDKTDIAQASNDISALSVQIAQYALDHKGLPDSLADIGQAGMLDPWGNPYQYLNHQNLKGNGGLRKDKNIVPINSDFDLYSMGKDGLTSAPLTAVVSRDDIVRANNGRFVGLASVY